VPLRRSRIAADFAPDLAQISSGQAIEAGENIGAVLMFTGISNTCGMGMVLAKMP
jgi:hypothetical protein